MQSNPKNTASRDANINLRAPKKQRDLIDQAAGILGKTRTDFIMDTMTTAATDILLDQRIFKMDDAAFKAFQAALDAPAKPNKKLKKLLAMTPVWEL